MQLLQLDAGCVISTWLTPDLRGDFCHLRAGSSLKLAATSHGMLQELLI